MALLPARESQGLCWALLVPARSPASLQNSLDPFPCLAKARAGLSCPPDSPGAFAGLSWGCGQSPAALQSGRALTGLCRSPSRALLPSREPRGFRWALPSPGQSPATLQRAPGSLPGFAGALLPSRFSWHLRQPLEGPGQCPTAFQRAPGPSLGFAWARAALAGLQGHLGEGLVHLVQ